MASINPLRYRGYYYDAETELYYLKSRYYDPEICRFINADNFPSTGQTILGCNMFVYCGNNPVFREDSYGNLWETILGGAIAGAAVSLCSYIVTTEDRTIGGALAAAGVGAATGALSAVTGAYKIVASVGAGLLSAVYSGVTSEGSTWEKVCTAVVTGASTFAASYIPAIATYEGGATFLDDFANVYANYKVGFTRGSHVELVTEFVRHGAQRLAEVTQPYVDEFIDSAKALFSQSSRNIYGRIGASSQMIICIR